MTSYFVVIRNVVVQIKRTFECWRLFFWACDVKIRHIFYQTQPATQKFIAYIALRFYSNVDAKKKKMVKL